VSSVAAVAGDSEPKPRRLLWILAAVVALGLHVGGGWLALAQLQDDQAGTQLGAEGIAVGLVFGSEKTEETDLPPGPDSNESAASPQLSEQKAVEKETDLPKETPVESETPDRLVTTADSKKPTEEQTEVATVQQNASDPSVAQEATARPNMDQEGDGVIEQGLLKDMKKAEAEWNAMISAVIDRHRNQHYPKDVKRKSGSVKVSFMLNRLGKILQVLVLESSGDAAYDKAAIALIRSCDPMPKPPTKLTEDTFSRTLVVNFSDPNEAVGRGTKRAK